MDNDKKQEAVDAVSDYLISNPNHELASHLTILLECTSATIDLERNIVTDETIGIEYRLYNSQVQWRHIRTNGWFWMERVSTNDASSIKNVSKLHELGEFVVKQARKK